MGFRVIAYAAVAAHFAFLAFGVFGGFLAWRWPRLIWLQVAGAAWMVLVAVASLMCPLTWIEDRARERAGMPPKPGGFLANSVEGVFYPAGHRTTASVVAAAVVLFSWIGFAVLRRRSQRHPDHSHQPRPDASRSDHANAHHPRSDHPADLRLVAPGESDIRSD